MWDSKVIDTFNAARAALTAGAALTRTRGVSLLEDLHLLGRQDLAELGLGLFLKFGNLFLLIFREVQLLDRKTRDQMEPASSRRDADTCPSSRYGAWLDNLRVGLVI